MYLDVICSKKRNALRLMRNFVTIMKLDEEL